MRLKVLPEKSPWYADGLSFTCTQCGNCCTGGPGYVWISQVEIDRLAEYLKLPRENVLRKYCRSFGDRISLNEHRNSAGQYDCIFLKETPATPDPAHPERIVHPKRTCTIYPVRPLQCRTWPFWDGLLAAPENWNNAAQRCPGMNHGKSYSKTKIEALRDAADWPEQAPTSGKTPRSRK
jgi:Fe-S-cluster containining protein